MRPPRPRGSPEAAASGGAMMPPPHTTQRVRTVEPSPSDDVAGPDLGHRDAEVQPDALAAEDLRGVVVRAVGERPEQRVRRGPRGGSAPPRPRGGGTRRSSSRATRSASAPPARRRSARRRRRRRSARPGRSAPDRGRPPRTPRGSASAGAWRRRASRAGTRAPRRRACGRSSAAIPRPGRSRRRRPRSPPASVTVRASGSSDATSPELDVDVGVVAEQLAQRERDVAGRQLRGRDLVEQRLELVVVVAVDQRDAHVARRARAASRSRRRRSRRRRRRRARRPLLRSGDMLRLPRARRAPRRSSRWSPTRRALAIAVSAGFTAPMLGKKLVSTT